MESITTEQRYKTGARHSLVVCAGGSFVVYAAAYGRGGSMAYRKSSSPTPHGGDWSRDSRADTHLSSAPPRQDDRQRRAPFGLAANSRRYSEAAPRPQFAFAAEDDDLALHPSTLDTRQDDLGHPGQ